MSSKQVYEYWVLRCSKSNMAGRAPDFPPTRTIFPIILIFIYILFCVINNNIITRTFKVKSCWSSSPCHNHWLTLIIVSTNCCNWITTSFPLCTQLEVIFWISSSGMCPHRITTSCHLSITQNVTSNDVTFPLWWFNIVPIVSVLDILLWPPVHLNEYIIQTSMCIFQLPWSPHLSICSMSLAYWVQVHFWIEFISALKLISIVIRCLPWSVSLYGPIYNIHVHHCIHRIFATKLTQSQHVKVNLKVSSTIVLKFIHLFSELPNTCMSQHLIDHTPQLES
jgi:hypothetical protein